MGVASGPETFSWEVGNYDDKTLNLLMFSLKCNPIYPGIHKDPSIGAQT